VTDASGCPRCGYGSPGVGRAGLCPSCLLALALAADDDPGHDDRSDEPAAIYRVLTILASEADRTTYLAEQDGSRQLVTLDVVRVDQVTGDKEPASFSERMRALTNWVHPGAPRVLEGRLTPSGDFCVVAHYATGPALDRYCDTHEVGGPRRARLFANVCETVADGHLHGVCHGRLRPDRVVATEAGGEAVPVVLGYSIIPDHVPTVDEDVAGLEQLARAMGWQGPPGRSWASVDALRAGASSDWPETVAIGPEVRARG
jgi:hypothetical protein